RVASDRPLAADRPPVSEVAAPPWRFAHRTVSRRPFAAAIPRPAQVRWPPACPFPSAVLPPGRLSGLMAEVEFLTRPTPVLVNDANIRVAGGTADPLSLNTIRPARRRGSVSGDRLLPPWPHRARPRGRISARHPDRTREAVAATLRWASYHDAGRDRGRG